MFELKDQWAAQALDGKQLRDQHAGFGVIDSSGPVESSEPFGVDLKAITALVDGAFVSHSATTIDLREFVDDTRPRKAVIVITTDAAGTGSGTIEVRAGTPEAAAYPPDSPRESVFEAYRPAPPALWDAPVVPLAETYLDPNADGIAAEHIRDRRVSARASVDDLAARSIDVGMAIEDAAGIDHQNELADLQDVADVEAGVPRAHDDLTGVQEGQHRSAEQFRELLFGSVVGGQDIAISNDDAADTITFDATGGAANTQADLYNDAGLVVANPQAVTYRATADSAASVSVSDDGDSTGTVEIAATDTDTQAFSLAASGTTSLDGSESVVVDTGVAVDAGYYDPVPGEWPDGMDVALSIERDTAGTGNFLLHIEQNTSSVTSGSVGWQLLESTLGGGSA